MTHGSLGTRRDFRALFDQLDGVALWTATGPGEFDYISAGFEDIWGIPPEDVKDDISLLIDSIHPEDRDRVRENIERRRREPVTRRTRAASSNQMDRFGGCSRGRSRSETTTARSPKSSVSVRISRSNRAASRSSNC
ncbi:PAS domain-containing protein [Halorubrum saccharovorum]|uniref:PAS domain-containing protein n=1 Tax=Halorubrum saccharovorum TaxID=2248 RepID=UPI001F1F6A70|nr:PAS domain-containing protein [Halorubrum saccharovorum]